MFNYRLLTLVFLSIGAMLAVALLRLDIDTDIVRSLPTEQTVISDALDIFTHHPIHDQIAVDISLDRDDPDILVACAKQLEEALRNSTLFAEVGSNTITSLIPEIALHVTQNLPILFSRQELEEAIAPRLEKDFIDKRFQEAFQKLSSLEGIGQSRFIAADPLGFMEPVMAKMAMLAPLPNTRIYKGFVFSPDNRHLLVTARPNSTGTNTTSARQISKLLQNVAAELSTQYSYRGIQVTLTPVGAYRAALDNERIIRHDVNLALLLSTFGIGLLLFVAFPRPVLGLFSLLPALAGTAAALFLFSLIHPSISIMVLGFGGAIISITVDHGIAYLLFLDRPRKTKGKEASTEVRAIGILAVLTTCGAFLTLSFSGFPIFVQLGQFAAMGVLCSFVFVHCVFPRITPTMMPCSRRNLPLQKLVDRLYSSGRTGAIAAALLAAVLLLFARPDFNVSLESMNTMSSETLAADKLFKEVWGNMGSRVILMTTENSIRDMQETNDRILKHIESDIKADSIQAAFVPSMLFPGKELQARNRMSWKQFWSTERIEKLQNDIRSSSTATGFSATAFESFFHLFSPTFETKNTTLAKHFYPLMGISADTDGQLTQFINVTPGKQYTSQDFYDRYGVEGKIFDSPYFSEQLADILFSSFATMLAIIAISISILLLFFFASWQLTLITLLPPLFAYVCTLGTMKLIGHSLDIPGLMLSIVILGMGIDYSIFFVRAHQRYRTPDHPSFKLVRVAVFMAATSTVIGFGVLCLAEHSLLRSIGITSLLGIGYSLLGAFLLLPPLLKIYFSKKDSQKAPELSLNERVQNRYRLVEAYPRMFARFKLKYDPMFAELPELLGNDQDRIETILDIGCGYGVPGCWCLEYCPNAKLFGLDPDKERVRVAALAMGQQGEILEDMAPDLPPVATPPDLVLLLDMLHYLDDASVRTLFKNCFQTLNHRGLLLTRFVIRPDNAPSWSWKLEDRRVKLSGEEAHYRSQVMMAKLMEEAGFRVEQNRTTATNSELVWLMGRSRK